MTKKLIVIPMEIGILSILLKMLKQVQHDKKTNCHSDGNRNLIYLLKMLKQVQHDNSARLFRIELIYIPQINPKKNYLAPQNFECKCVFNNEFG